MTMIAVQQNPHHPQPHNYTSPVPGSIHLQESLRQNGTSSVINSRLAVNNDPDTDVEGSDQDQFPTLSTRPLIRTNGDVPRDRSVSLQNRPTSAPGTHGESSQDESELERPRRRPQLLLRSKSDFGPRGEDPDSQEEEEEIQDWGARHGFEDHYASEEYVSQLANVGCSFLNCQLPRISPYPREPARIVLLYSL